MLTSYHSCCFELALTNELQDKLKPNTFYPCSQPYRVGTEIDFTISRDRKSFALNTHSLTLSQAPVAISSSRANRHNCFFLGRKQRRKREIEALKIFGSFSIFFNLEALKSKVNRNCPFGLEM